MDGYSLGEQSGTNELYQALSLKSRMTDTLAVGLVSYDQDGNCVVANDAAARIIGGSREDLLTQNYYELESWQRSGLALAAKSVMETGTEFHGEFHLTSSFGKEVWGYCSLSRFTQNGKLHLMLVFQDISLLKSTESTLRTTQELLHKFFEYSPVYTFIKDEQSRPVMLSRNYEGLFNTSLENILGRQMNELLPDDVARRVVLEDQNVMASSEVFQEDDEINGRYYTTTKFAIHHESGTSLGGFMVDVTEQKLVEKTAQEYAADIQALVETAPDALCIFDEAGAILEVNAGACELYGYSRDELLVMSRADLEAEKGVQDSPQSGVSCYHTCRKRKDGALLYLQVRAVTVQHSGKTIEFTRSIG